MFFYGEVFQVPDLQSGFSLFLTILESKSTKNSSTKIFVFEFRIPLYLFRTTR